MMVKRVFARHASAGSYNNWRSPDGKAVSDGWVVEVDAAVLPADSDSRGLSQQRNRPAFDTWADAVAWLDSCGVRPAGWKRVKGGDYVMDPSGTDTPCDRPTTGGDSRWPIYTRCDKRRKPGEDACGLHLAADRKAAERTAARKAERERSEAGSQIAEDAIEALAGLGIDAQRHYQVPLGSGMGRYTGKVTVHAEDVLALVRRLSDAAALLGEDMPQ